MKVAVSIPDRIFEQAERVSKRLKVPRSHLYARAVEAYVKGHSGGDITRRLNEVYARVPREIDAGVEGTSLEVLRREKW